MASLTTIFRTSAEEGTEAPSSTPMRTPHSQRGMEASFISPDLCFLLSLKSAGKEALLTSELPAGGGTHKFLLEQSEGDMRTNRINRLLHGENVFLHARHVEVVFRRVLLEECTTDRHADELGDAFDHDRFFRLLGADHAARISSKILGLARLAARAEEEGSVQPQP